MLGKKKDEIIILIKKKTLHKRITHLRKQKINPKRKEKKPPSSCCLTKPKCFTAQVSHEVMGNRKGIYLSPLPKNSQQFVKPKVVRKRQSRRIWTGSKMMQSMPDSTQGNPNHYLSQQWVRLTTQSQSNWNETGRFWMALNTDPQYFKAAQHEAVQTHGQKRNTGKVVASSNTAMTCRSCMDA